MADAENWPVATDALLLAAQLVEAIQEGLATSKEKHQGPWNLAHPARQPGSRTSPAPENQPQP